jgi:protein tyrosine/serine phosphatase
MIREAVREQTGRLASDQALMTAMRVEAEYLAGAFAAIREAYGSLDGYLDDALGLDAGLRERVRARILA